MKYPERFWSKVDKSGDCWLWTGNTTKAGYGVCYPDGKSTPRRLAHRAAWEEANGQIPDGLSICHRCDNPPCVRPDHLFSGTQADNIRDMMSKGRHGYYDKSGEKNPRARLTSKQVAEIRRLYAIGRYKPRQKNAPYDSKRLSAMFGVARSTIRLVTCGRNWK